MEMKAALARFWTAFLSVAAVVGLYLAALDVDLLPVFWASLSSAVLLGIIPIAFRQAVQISEKIRKYPVLLQRAAELEEKNEKLTEDLNLATSVTGRWSDGVIEGRYQVLGALLATQCPTVHLLGVEANDGQVFLLGQWDGVPPSINTRLNLVTVGSESSKGVLQIVNVDAEKKVVKLQCVDAIVPDFWQHLNDRAARDPSPPAGVKLVPFEFPEWPTLDGAKYAIATENEQAEE
ncbi:hypothetical protein [Lentzea sp. NPDC092896]|uniref:hypothetical protein n=1 Tax=Lentzea sp. NPDC092896 TaxID=3364127 RepID=UPI0038199FD2